MQVDPPVTAVAHGIQLAVAPVFLLSGIGAFLAVLAGRLARVIDRARILEGLLEGADEARRAKLLADLHTLSVRARWINRAISLCTVCALLVCAVVAALVLDAFQNVDASKVIAILFVTAMSALFTGLLCFLREIYEGTRTLRIGPW